MVKFAKFVPTESTLNDLGTLKKVIGKGGSVKFAGKKNLTSNKRVALIGKNAKGDSAVIACSESVSTHVRAGFKKGAISASIVAWLLSLTVLENEEGLYFVSMPAGSSSPEYSVDTVTAEAEEAFTPEEIIG